MITQRAARRASTRVITAAAVTIAWWSLLGWDTEYYVGSDARLRGPYSTGQVVGFAVVLLVAAVWFGVRRDVIASSGIAAASAAVNFGISAARSTGGDDGLWPAGALMLAVAVFLGGIMVGSVAGLIDARVRRASV